MKTFHLSTIVLLFSSVLCLLLGCAQGTQPTGPQVPTRTLSPAEHRCAELKPEAVRFREYLTGKVVWDPGLSSADIERRKRYMAQFLRSWERKCGRLY
jgi:hypothetical protein